MTSTLAAAFPSPACLIAGRFEHGDGDIIESVNPATEELIATAPGADERQVAAAVRAARHAFDGGPWARLSGGDRARMLHRLADLMERDREHLVEVVITELGSPFNLATSLQVDVPIKYLRWFADAALRGPRGGREEALPVHRDTIASSSVLLREPAGVVAAITPYNYPINLAIWKLGPALASGCTVVLQPSPRAVLSTNALVGLIEEAGFPAGVVNFVFGGPSVTRQLADSDEVDMVSFTGSSRVGAIVMQTAARTLKKVVLELGGKSPNLILPGAEIDPTIVPSVLRFCRNAGQGCGATTRIFVPRQSFEPFLGRATETIRNLVVGDPRSDRTDVGPLITREHRDGVEGYVARARAAGALIACGGGRPSDLPRGFYFEPTLVHGISNDAEIAQEELFAPIAVVTPYDSVDEAVHLANATRYGLNANIWGPTAEALDVAGRLRAGTVAINGGGAMRPDAPWGGYRQSGIGREGGEDGYLEYFEVKHVQWPL